MRTATAIRPRRWVGPGLGGGDVRPGAGDVNDVISADGQTIAVPSGRFTAIDLLGSSVFGPQAGTFVVTYTDGTTSRFTLTLSDWVDGFTGRGTTAPGESIAATTPYTDDGGGTFAQPAYVYGYSFPIAQGKTVRSITLPVNGKIKILAVDLI